jgi:hypothetical protein
MRLRASGVWHGPPALASLAAHSHIDHQLKLACALFLYFDAFSSRESSYTSLENALGSYCAIVRTTLETGRALTVGSFRSFASASSYSGKVCRRSLAFI